MVKHFHDHSSEKIDPQKHDIVQWNIWNCFQQEFELFLYGFSNEWEVFGQLKFRQF